MDWLAHYGLLAVLAGFAARQGHLDLRAVILVAFIGGTLGDQFFFWFGAGHPFGRVLQAGLGELEHYEGLVVAVIVGAATVVFVARHASASQRVARRVREWNRR